MNPTSSTEMISSGGAGYGGVGGGNFPIFGLFGAIPLGGRGAFGQDGAGDNCLNQRITDLQVAGVNTNINSAESNILQATQAQTQSLGVLTGNGFDRIERDIFQQSIQAGNVASGINNNITATHTGISTTLCNMEHNLTAQANANTQVILDKMCMAETQALRDQLASEREEKNFLKYGNLPLVQAGSVVTSNPCATNGATEQINIINQNVNAIGSVVAQLADAVNKLKA